MEEILKDTYGITVYQEQVMLLSQKIGDFTKGEADILRKAMGKKQKEVLDKMKPKFLENSTKKGFKVEKLKKFGKIGRLLQVMRLISLILLVTLGLHIKQHFSRQITLLNIWHPFYLITCVILKM